MTGRRRRAGAWLFAFLLGLPVVTSAQDRPLRTVVFVCEHGAARSVIAAAYFNELAAEAHLDFHAVARGVTPQPKLSAPTVTGLRADGVPFPSDRPRALTEADVRNAVRIVAFCPLPSFAKRARVDTYDVPAPADGYAASRDAILVHVKALIGDLAGSARSRAPR
jgi:arsenate reductase (thioredoxin)